MVSSWLPGIGLTLLPHLGGIAGAFITKTQVKQWYERKIDRPSWRPPNWVFAPVWTSLYTAMGYSSYLIYRDAFGSNRNLALSLYATQLGLNWMWTPIFFQYHQLGLATFEIAALWSAIVGCIWTFYPINKTAAYLLVPYIAWVSFASALTFEVWRRNRGRKFD